MADELVRNIHSTRKTGYIHVFVQTVLVYNVTRPLYYFTA